jgi:hypothetical protein
MNYNGALACLIVPIDARNTIYTSHAPKREKRKARPITGTKNTYGVPLMKIEVACMTAKPI